MSDLIILVYRNQTEAYVSGETLVVLQQEAGTEPEDIVVVTRAADGRVSVNQSIDLASGEPLGGGRWGTLLGMMFLDTRKPKPGGKGLAAQFAEAGLDEKFVVAVGQALKKGEAAVAMRVRLLGTDRVLEKVKTLKGTPKVIRTRLSADTEDALHDLQDQIPQHVLSQFPSDGLI